MDQKDPDGRGWPQSRGIDYPERIVTDQLDPPAPRAELRLRWVYWIALSLICVGLDVWAGPHIQFPVVYLVPISLASWYSGLRWGLTLAAVLALFRLLLYGYEIWDPPSSILESSINAVIRLVVFVSFAWLVDRTSRQMKELRRMTLLEQMLGVCSVCRKVHDERAGAWEPLEAYVAGHRSDFKHAICPTCAGQHRDVFDRR